MYLIYILQGVSLFNPVSFEQLYDKSNNFQVIMINGILKFLRQGHLVFCCCFDLWICVIISHFDTLKKCPISEMYTCHFNGLNSKGYYFCHICRSNYTGLKWDTMQILHDNSKPIKVCFFIRKYLQNHLAHKIHIFCPIEINEIYRAEIVNFVCQMVLQEFSYKKQTLVYDVLFLDIQLKS